jgi:rhomboid protease GluP
MDPEEPEIVVKATSLSKKPAEGSALVAAASLLVLTGFSLLFWSDISGLSSQLPANRDLIFRQGQYWRLWTSIFVHADLKHLLSNMPGFGLLSYLLYGYFGFRVHFCLILVAGALATGIAVRTYGPQTFLLGASGVVYLMAAFWLTMYVCLERRFSIGRRILRATGFLLIVLIPTSFPPEVSYRSHAIGFAVGIVVAVVYFLFNKNRFRREEVIEIEYGLGITD